MTKNKEATEHNRKPVDAAVAAKETPATTEETRDPNTIGGKTEGTEAMGPEDIVDKPTKADAMARSVPGAATVGITSPLPAANLALNAKDADRPEHTLAYVQGRLAKRAGVPAEDTPYGDGADLKAWRKGYDFEAKHG